MKSYYGNYLGVVITGGDKDPEHRGRTQVFIPNIMPALYENWNQPGEDITFEVIGQGLDGSLNPQVVDRLRNTLPWAECAVPITGASPSYGTSVGGFVSEVIRNVGVAGEAVKEAAKSAWNALSGPPPTDQAGTLAALTNSAAADKFGSGYCGTAVAESVLEKVYGYSDKEIRAGSSSGRRDGGEYNNILPKLGWKAVKIDKPEDAPPGAIISYAGTSENKYGHVEAVGQNASGQKTYLFGLGEVSSPGGGTRVATRNKKGFQGVCWLPPDDRVAAAAAKKGLPNVSPSALPNPQPATGMQPDPTKEQEAAVALDSQQKVDLGMQSSPEQMSLGGKTTGGLPIINPSDVKSVGSSQTRTASVYGSVTSDFTTYLDVKPEQRPPEATEYWRSRGYDIEKQEAQLRSRLNGWKPSLNLSDTGKGAYLAGQGQANLTPGFSVAVPSNNAYGLKPGSFIQIKNSKGEPIGPNNGYFQVADKGNSQNLSKLNALDFYSGNDPELKKYFSGLNGENLNVQPVEISGESANLLKQSLAQQGNAALEGMTTTDVSGLAGAAGMATNQPIVQNPTPHHGISGPNTNNQALGTFGYASEGQAVWVFFREGNPLFPVYFAASYGNKEWGNMYQNASNAFGSGTPGTLKMQSMFYGGGFNSSLSTNESEVGQGHSFQLFDNNGSNLTFAKDHTQFNAMYNHVQRVMGDSHDITETNKEVRVKGNYNTFTEQDMFITIGNWTDDAIAASDEIQSYINEAMEIKAKAGKS